MNIAAGVGQGVINCPHIKLDTKASGNSGKSLQTGIILVSLFIDPFQEQCLESGSE